MPRLTPQQWEQAKADYEVRGISLGEVARRHGVDRAAVSRRAKAEGWIQGKYAPLAEGQARLLCRLAGIELELRTYPPAYRRIAEQIILERLLADALQRRLHEAAAKGTAFDLPSAIHTALDDHARTMQRVNDLADRLGGNLPRQGKRAPARPLPELPHTAAASGSTALA